MFSPTLVEATSRRFAEDMRTSRSEISTRILLIEEVTDHVFATNLGEQLAKLLNALERSGNSNEFADGCGEVAVAYEDLLKFLSASSQAPLMEDPKKFPEGAEGWRPAASWAANCLVRLCDLVEVAARAPGNRAYESIGSSLRLRAKPAVQALCADDWEQSKCNEALSALEAYAKVTTPATCPVLKRYFEALRTMIRTFKKVGIFFNPKGDGSSSLTPRIKIVGAPLRRMPNFESKW